MSSSSQHAAHGAFLSVQAQAARGNNYSRPEGQNVGNFLSDRPSSKVSNAPGGSSQVRSALKQHFKQRQQSSR